MDLASKVSSNGPIVKYPSPSFPRSNSERSVNLKGISVGLSIFNISLYLKLSNNVPEIKYFMSEPDRQELKGGLNHVIVKVL